MNKKSNIIFVGVLGITFALIISMLFLIYKEVSTVVTLPLPSTTGAEAGEFSINFIRESNKNTKKENYMISPYSVEMALSLLRDGTDTTTFDEINKVAPERAIKDLSIKDKVNIANGIFIKDTCKDKVKSDYITRLRTNYNAEVSYDKFRNPDVINAWVKKQTNGMIEKLLDNLDPQFVLALVNAIALEEDWQVSFEGEDTYKEEFTLINNKKMDVNMMHATFGRDVSYYEDDDMKSVVLPYKMYSKAGKEVDDGEQLEFIGILPNDDIDKYIDSLTIDKIKEIDKNKKTASSDYKVNVALPKFKFDYTFDGFGETLGNMGIHEVFSPGADFSKMLDDDGKIFINKAIHKTYVEIDEEGTRAAAVTGFTFKDNAVMVEEKMDTIKFDRPFIFMIKDTKSDEILFFGAVYEPSKYVEKK